MGAKWVVGAVIQLGGSIVINLGQNLMKLGYDKKAEACAKGEGQPIYKYWQWVFGWLAFAVGNVCNFSSYAFASQALLTAISSAQFVSNVLFAWLLLGERVRLRVLLATGIIIAGNVVLVAFASKSDPSYTSHKLRNLYTTDQFSMYLTVAFGGGVPLTYIVAQYGLQKMAQPAPPTTLWLKITPIAYSVCSSLVGAQAVLFSTSLSILTRETLAGTNQLGHWFTAVLVVGLVFCAAFWVTRLNQSLRWFPAVVIIPMLQIIWILLIMVSGNLYFREFNRFSRLQLAMFLVGVTLLMVGICCLTPSSQPESSEEGHSSKLCGINGGMQQQEEDVVATVTLLGQEGAKSPQVHQSAGPRHAAQPLPPLCLPPVLGQLDVRALARLPHNHLLAVLAQLQLVPRTEEEARLLEQTLEQLAWQQKQQAQPTGQAQQQECSAQQLVLEGCGGPAPRQQQPEAACREMPLLKLWPSDNESPLAHSPKVASCHLQEQQQWCQSAPDTAAPWQHASAMPGSHCMQQQLTHLQPYLHWTNTLQQGQGEQQTHPGHGGTSAWGAHDSPNGVSMATNPLFEDQGTDSAAHAAVAPAAPAAPMPGHQACSSTPPILGTTSPPACTLHVAGPAHALRRRAGRRSSSIAKLAAAAKGAATRLRHSVVETAGLMAGMGESEQLKAASVFAMPMLASDMQRTVRTASTLLHPTSRRMPQLHAHWLQQLASATPE